MSSLNPAKLGQNQAKTTKVNEYANFWKATHCSLGFFVSFISLNSIQNIQSQMLEDNGFDKLGFYSNAILYLALGIGSLVSSWVLKKIGEANSMGIGCLMSVFFMASFIFPSLKKEQGYEGFWFEQFFVYFIILLCSFTNGIGEAVMWVAQGKYISECATINNKGFFFSYFWAYFMST